MKILLVIPNYGSGSYSLPSGLLAISSYLKYKGYNVTCLNLNHYNSSKLPDVLKEHNFDVIGTGGIFLYLEHTRNIIKTTREHSPKSKIIVGGGLATGDPKFILEELKPDYLVLGEGEIATDNLLQTLKNKSDVHSVSGVAFKDKGRFIKTSPTPLIENLDQLPYPDYEGFEYGYYLDNFNRQAQHLSSITTSSRRRIGFVLSSRDCPARCTFCFRVMGGKYRLRSLKNLFGEIRYLVEEYNINELSLLDDMFAAHKERVIEFCETIKPMGLIWTCQLRVNIVSDDLLKAMKDSGCREVSYGFESASRAVLKSMRKGINPELIEKAITATIKAKMSIQGNFIFGDPAENIETMQETIDFGRKFKKTNIGFRLISPYPGTTLYENVIEKGILTNVPAYYADPYAPVDMTSLSKIDFLYLWRKVEFENNYRRRFAFGKIINIKKTGQQTFDIDVYCPHCKGGNENYRLNFSRGSMLVCKHCYQRFFINMADFRFGNVSQIYQYCYLNIKRIILYNAAIHRVLFFVPTLIEKTAAICRAIVNLGMKARQLLIQT